jgi:hypothetical protein
MNEEKRTNVIGVLIVLIAVMLVAVGIFGLLSRNSRTTITLPSSGTGSEGQPNPAPTDAPAAVAPSVAGQSAVVRGGSRSKPTTTNETAVVANSSATGEVMLPGETATTVGGGLINVPGGSAFRIEVLSALYDVSGKPTQGCSVFDNRVPARRFTFQLAVVNDSGANFQPGEWGAAAYIGTARTTLCFSGAGALPAFPNGTRQQVSLVAFANPDQSITSVSISTLNGLSARVCFQEERVVACPPA